jgi:hypothetical protein
MTEQLKAALDALNACPDADAVADLLRRHGIRASRQRGKGIRCSVCPLAAYFLEVGVARDPWVSGFGYVRMEGERVQLKAACLAFIALVDAGNYPDLEAAA